MIGFIYLWFDSGRHSSGHPNRRMFCLGSHCGTENDGYLTSTGGIRFKNAYKKRPQDFRRRIIERIYEGNGRDVLNAEQRWLDLIKAEELNQRYYNKKKTAAGLSREDLLRLHAENPEISQRQGTSLKNTHIADPTLKVRMGIAISASYAANPEINKRRGEALRKTNEADPSINRRRGDGVRNANAADPEIGRRKGSSLRITHAANPGLGKGQGQTRKDNYRADPERQARKKKAQKEAYEKDPTYRSRVGEGVKRSNKADPSIGLRRGSSISTTLQASPDSRKRIGEGNRIWRTGTRWINNGIKRRQLRPGEPIPEGWFLGYKLKDPTS